VVTTNAFGGLADDPEQGIVRTGDLMASRIVRAVLRRPPLPQQSQGVAAPIDKPPPALVTKILVPDAYLVSWAPFAAMAVRRLMRTERFDALITTSPYESVHVIGLAEHRSCVWVADFRDGWTFEPHRVSFPTALQRQLDAALERRVVRTADVVLAATRPIADDFRRRLHVPALEVPNGFEPPEPQVSGEAPLLEAGYVNLVYTGTLSGPWGRDPAPLIEALRRIAQEPEVASRLRLVIAGRLTESEQRLLSTAGPLVRHVGLLSRASAQALQRAASGLVLITSSNTSEATGKVFEYLGAERPILALADGNEAARIVTETRTGMTVRPDDPERVAVALRGAVDGALARSYAPRNLDLYRYPGPAKTVEAAIEEAIMRRSSA
jgi:glycosyltransferase involved in cell wall biosynthesis